MIELFYFPTPNGRKITIALEELQLPYRLRHINILAREQFQQAFLSISPNNKIPAIIDYDTGGEPQSVFESGAILVYLAEKTGQLLPQSGSSRVAVWEWLMWQVGGLGPMAGQANHFNHYAREQVPYAQKRYTTELQRLYGVMDRRLQAGEYLCDEFSIADIACYGWVQQAATGGVTLSEFEAVQRWYDRMSDRSAVKRALAQDEAFAAPAPLNDEQHASLFEHTR